MGNEPAERADLPAISSADPAAPTPLYHQVEVAIRARIHSRSWSPGMKIPTEDQLCEQFRVSRITIRHALRNLVEQGLLNREPGRGTFVRDTTLTAGVRGLTSFTAEMEALGFKAGARVLSIDVAPAADDVADVLGLEPGADVVVIVRLRTGDGRPVGLQTAYLPAARFPGLDGQVLDDRSLYGVLREHYGVSPSEAVETFRIDHLDAESAALLQVEPGECAFAVERLTSTAHEPFEFVRSFMRSDRYRIRQMLRNP